MSSSLYTEKEIKLLIKDAAKKAPKNQKEAHDEAMQKLVDGHTRPTSSPLSGNNLKRTSGLSYNSMGGISSTPLATMPRPVPAGHTSASSGDNSSTASAQPAAADYF